MVKKYDPKPPECIKNDETLLALYVQGDLEFKYVYDECKALKPLKGIEINLQQVEFWYKEFLRMGWRKKHFDKQLEAVKRAKLYNRIDLENWLETEVMYNEIDMEVRTDRKIDFMIHKAEQLKKTEIELTPEEEKYVQAAEYKKIKFEFDQKRYEIMEKAAKDFREEYQKGLSGLKKRIMDMNLADRTKLLDKAIDEGKIKCKKTGFEFQAALHNLGDFADLIYCNNKN